MQGRGVMKDRRLRKIEWVAWLGLAVVSFALSIIGISTIGQALMSQGAFGGISSTSLALIQGIFVYGAAFALLLGMGRLLGMRVTLRELGLTWLRWRDIALAVAGFVTYALIGTLVMMILKKLLPGLPLDQTQDLGFTNVFGNERILAFVTLVVVAPFIEELLFRGLLYRKMRKASVNVVVSTLVVSTLFALAHWQLNVGIDVFILSVIACMAREYTGSIGASILIHMMKNAVAFYVLFVVGTATLR